MAIKSAGEDAKPAGEGAIKSTGENTLEPAGRAALEPAGENALRAILRASILGMLATAVLLGVVSATAGLGVAGWIAGLATGAAAPALLIAARRRSDQPSVHPADWVTLTRAVLIAGVAGLVADSFSRPVPVTALVTLSIVALVLDAVDGQVARRTGTATPLGGRLDGEADAFLILLLSIFVAQGYGGWVLAIGAARYAFLLAGWLIPWLAAPLPPRFWRKVVAAVQGIVLTVAASGVPSRLIVTIALVAALLLLAESFGRDVVWLYRTGAGPRFRRAVRIALAALAVLIVWFDLLAPDRAWQFSLSAFVRIPVELLVLVAAALVLPRRPRRIVATIAGVLVGLLTIDKILNIVFYEELNRPFNPVSDWVSIRPGRGRDTRRHRHHAHQHRARRGRDHSHPAHRHHHRINGSHHYRGRPSPPRRRPRPCCAHRPLGAVRGPVPAARPGVPGRLGQRDRAGRFAGARHSGGA